MKKLNLLTLLLAVCLVCTLSLTFLAGAEENTSTQEEVYVPVYDLYKSEDMEGFDTTSDACKNEAYGISRYVWNNSLLYLADDATLADGEFETVKDSSEVLNGNQSFKWNAKVKAGSDGWTGTRFGVPYQELSGSEGGYMLRLTMKIRLVGMKSFVIKAAGEKTGANEQHMAFDSTYKQTSVDKKDLPETKKEIYVSQDGTWATIGFAYRSPVSETSYFIFDGCADPDAKESYVIVDDIVVGKERQPDVEYRPYKPFINEGFEDGSIDESMFAFDATTNPNSAKNENLNTEKCTITDEALFETKSATFRPSAVNKVTTVNSKTVTLAANYYKLYFLARFDTVKTVGINVVNAADDSVVYSFNYNITKSSREESATVTLFDRFGWSGNTSNVYTAYGEFNVTDSTDVYLQLRFTGTQLTKAHVTFDDICLLQSYEYEPLATEFPTDNAQRLNKTIAAKYEQINATVASALAAYATEITATGSCLCIGAVCVGGVVSKKKKKYICAVLAVLMVLATLFAAAACNNNTTKIAAGYQVVTPERIEGKLDNPGIGWVVLEEPTYGGHIDIGSSGDLPEASLGSLSTTWFHIEKEEGVYDWTMCDQAVNYWNGTGRRILLRISTDSCVWPYTYNAAPMYLFDKYNVNYEMVPYTDGVVTTARVVDMADPIYRQRLSKFLEALYEHYKDNPMVETVEIRGFGMWGEWHHGYEYETKQQRVTVLHDIIDAYVGAFEDSGKNLVVSCSWDPDYTSTGAYSNGYSEEEAYQNYVSWSGFDHAFRLDNVSYRRDGAASALNFKLDERLMAEAFRAGKRVPILGEYANNWGNINSPGSAYTLESALNDLLFKIRPNNSTTLNWVAVDLASIIERGDTDFIDRGNTMMGYRLAVEEALFPTAVSAGSEFTVRTTWTNSAVGIYPYVSPLKLMLLDKDGNTAYEYTDNEFDARTFVLGEINNVYSNLKVPAGLKNGKYTLAIAMPFPDHSATEHENIALAMAGETAENSRVYALGNIEVKNNVKLNDGGVKVTNWKDVDKLKLDANSTYEVTFKYQPHMDVANFYFGNDDCYKFSVVNGKEETNVYRWQDVSGETGQKTVTVRTGKGGGKLKIESINFDEIGIDEVWIEKKGSWYTDFNGYDVLDAKTLIAPTGQNAMGYTADKTDDDEGIDGDSLVLNSGLANDKFILAMTDSNNVKLKKGTRYTVSFDFRALGDVGDGGYYFVAAGDGSSYPQKLTDDHRVFGEWYERPDNWDSKKSFSFICEQDGMSILFGINQPGSYVIDNLIITATTPTTIVEGTDIGFRHNVIPVYEDIGLNKVERFARGTFQASGFNWGQFAWGRTTFDASELVEVTEESKLYLGEDAVVGKPYDGCSLLGRVEKEVYDPTIGMEWYEFTRTKREYYPFEAGKTYIVEFDYKILKSFKSGKCFVFFRDDTLEDRFAHVVETAIDPNNPSVSLGSASTDLSTGKQIGKTYHFKQTFVLPNYDNYQFTISMNGLWEMAVDNIYIYETK